jgi:hypothetical protein
MIESAQLYRDMAAYIKQRGYSPLYYGDHERYGCGCFLHAANACSRTPRRLVHLSTLLEVLGVREVSSGTLHDAGWTKGHADDAVAACLIAADLVEVEQGQRRP